MTKARVRIEEMMNELRRERDELRVRLHLAKLEASDEWKELESKLVKLEAKAAKLGNATAEASKDVAAAVTLLGQEVRDGFKRIAKQL